MWSSMAVSPLQLESIVSNIFNYCLGLTVNWPCNTYPCIFAELTCVTIAMIKAYEFILSKFPDHRAKIMELYNQQEDFRTLCIDFLNTVQSLEECRKNSINDKEIEIEFSELFVDLEREIIRLISQKRQSYWKLLGISFNRFASKKDAWLKTVALQLLPANRCIVYYPLTVWK